MGLLEEPRQIAITLTAEYIILEEGGNNDFAEGINT